MTYILDENSHIPIFSEICTFCKHLKESGINRTCEAFPKGIPMPIWLGENNHKEPFPNDNGIQFEELEEQIIMPKYRVYGIYTASKYLGEIEAENKEEAENLAYDDKDIMHEEYVSLCHQCADLEVSDLNELDIELVE